MWLSAIKLAVSAGSKIYANKQKTKMAMSEAQLMHAQNVWPEGEEAYQGKLVRSPTVRLEGRGSFDNSQFARVGACLGGHIDDDPTAMDKVKLFFEYVLAAPVMVHKPLDPCRGEYLWYKGYTNF